MYRLSGLWTGFHFYLLKIFEPNVSQNSSVGNVIMCELDDRFISQHGKARCLHNSGPHLASYPIDNILSQEVRCLNHIADWLLTFIQCWGLKFVCYFSAFATLNWGSRVIVRWQSHILIIPDLSIGSRFHQYWIAKGSTLRPSPVTPQLKP